MKILVVDDDSLMRKILVGSLAGMGHAVQAFETPQEVLAQIAADPSVDVLITDWTMPDMSGVELTRAVRQLPGGGFVHILLLTARQTREDYVEAIESGADDFLNKPLDPVMLVARLRAASRVLTLQHSLRENNELLTGTNAKLASAYDELRNDMEAAARVQQSLLPAPIARVGDATFCSALIPSATVSGDIYNFFPLSDGCIGLYTIDVAGHGARAAMLSFTLSRVLTPDTFEDEARSRDPGSIVADLNRRFQVRPPNLDYFTMLCGVMTPDGRLRFCQAGHPHPIHVHTAEARVSAVGGGGFPVGLMEWAAFDTAEIQLKRRDRIVFHSDGITECTSPDGELFGTERLHALLLAQRDEPCDVLADRLRAALVDWQKSESFKDDVSVMTCEWGA